MMDIRALQTVGKQNEKCLWMQRCRTEGVNGVKVDKILQEQNAEKHQQEKEKLVTYVNSPSVKKKKKTTSKYRLKQEMCLKKTAQAAMMMDTNQRTR